jgi:hypothetical protein
MAGIGMDNINQILIISGNSTHTSRHLTAAPSSRRNLADLLMANSIFRQKHKVIIFIIFSVEIVCVQTIAAQINLIAQDYLKVGVVFLYLFVDFFYLYSITHSLVVSDGHDLMPKLNSIVDQVIFFDDAVAQS